MVGAIKHKIIRYDKPNLSKGDIVEILDKKWNGSYGDSFTSYQYEVFCNGYTYLVNDISINMRGVFNNGINL